MKTDAQGVLIKNKIRDKSRQRSPNIKRSISKDVDEAQHDNPAGPLIDIYKRKRLGSLESCEENCARAPSHLPWNSPRQNSAKKENYRILARSTSKDSVKRHFENPTEGLIEIYKRKREGSIEACRENCARLPSHLLWNSPRNGKISVGNCGSIKNYEHLHKKRSSSPKNSLNVRKMAEIVFNYMQNKCPEKLMGDKD